MCSFFFSNLKIQFDKVNLRLKKRGPDLTKSGIIDEFYYIHNLLSITGKYTSQPLINNNCFMLYNGEIYNYKQFGQYENDTKALFDLYCKSKKIDFLDSLDGEYVFLIYDKILKKVFVVSDIFGTKPMYYAKKKNKFAFSSNQSSIVSLNYFSQVMQMPPNTIIEIDLINYDFKIIDDYYKFNLNQFKNSYDDWIKAFNESIKKRTATNKNIFITLSSGYDSGLIAANLNKQKIKYSAYSMFGKEDLFTLFQRKKISRKLKINHQIFNQTKKQYKRNYNYFKNNIDEYICDQNKLLSDDNAITGLVQIMRKAKKNNQKIYLSGQGADEIIGDYGFNGIALNKTSTLKGIYPKDLRDIFPWKNFYYGSQRKFLAKEENIAGQFGIEARYPFLDKKVVQEFLNLSIDLKHKFYKAPINKALTNLNYPITSIKEKRFKVGFKSKANLYNNSLKSYLAVYIFSKINLNNIKNKHRYEFLLYRYFINRINFINFLMKTMRMFYRSNFSKQKLNASN